MIFALGLIWSIVTVLAVLVFKVSKRSGLKAAGRDAVRTIRPLLIQLPCAVLAATFLIEVMPVDVVSKVIGPDAGALGMVVAAATGAFLPGGPMVAFPIAVVFQQSGAGLPQLIALITGWSVFVLNRLLTYEIPIMGLRFAVLRNLSCLALPLLAGFGTELVMILLDGS